MATTRDPECVATGRRDLPDGDMQYQWRTSIWCRGVHLPADRHIEGVTTRQAGQMPRQPCPATAEQRAATDRFVDRHTHAGGGCREPGVEPEGFEPSTFREPCGRSSRLSYGPKNHQASIWLIESVAATPAPVSERSRDPAPRLNLEEGP